MVQPLDRVSHPSILRDDDKNYGTVRFSSAGDAILTITGGGVIEVLNAQTGRTIASVCCSTIGGAVAFGPDGLFFICGFRGMPISVPN